MRYKCAILLVLTSVACGNDPGNTPTLDSGGAGQDAVVGLDVAMRGDGGRAADGAVTDGQTPRDAAPGAPDSTITRDAGAQPQPWEGDYSAAWTLVTPCVSTPRVDSIRIKPQTAPNTPYTVLWWVGGNPPPSDNGAAFTGTGTVFPPNTLRLTVDWPRPVTCDATQNASGFTCLGSFFDSATCSSTWRLDAVRIAP